jgi:RNA-directed DNA polymerase
MDLEKFFDRVNHDVLMARVAREVQDANVLRLIRKFLQAGMMANGVETPRYEGTPQGGPLSPLLSNILLTDLDRELEQRQLLFCRYADDCNIYVGSQRAGQRIMQSVKGFLANRLKLSVNEAKIRIATPSIDRLKESIRNLFIQGRGRSRLQTIDKLNPILRGWMNYFSLTQSRRPIEELDAWVRRRLRCLLWRQWRRPKTRESKMLALGLDAQRAWKSSVNGRGPWWNAGAKHMIAALPPKFFTQLGLVSLVATHQHLQRST